MLVMILTETVNLAHKISAKFDFIKPLLVFITLKIAILKITLGDASHISTIGTSLLTGYYAVYKLRSDIKKERKEKALKDLEQDEH